MDYNFWDDRTHELEINPCKGCEDYQGGKCISDGGCGSKQEMEEMCNRIEVECIQTIIEEIKFLNSRQTPMLQENTNKYIAMIEALEKQIPYKPKEYEDKYYGCKCGEVLLEKWELYPTKVMSKSWGLPYCLNCGQKLDWS